MKFCSECRRCYEDEIASCSELGHPALSEIYNGSCEMIRGYRLEFLVETGTRGDVYRARRTDCGQSCVIRIISADAQFHERFLSEARLAASLFHPNLADVYEAGALDDGRLFVVAEENRETLRSLLDNGGVPQLLTSIRIVRQIAEALHELHLKGLMHRAVRPENIVLTSDAENVTQVRVQNLDYGGVVEHSIVSNKFLIDTAIDSLRYFSPEQVSGDATGIKTDIYGLGVVFYEMLAGAPPFDDTKAAGIIEKHKHERPPDIKIDDFELRMLVTHSLTEALQKRPEKRQSSANAFARQLRHIEQLATHVSTPPPAVVVTAPDRPVSKAVSVVAERPRPVEVFVEQPVVVEPEIVFAGKSVFDEPVMREMPVAETAETLEEDNHRSGRRSRLKLHRKRTHLLTQLEPVQRERAKVVLEKADDDTPPLDEVVDAIKRDPSIVPRRTEAIKIEWEQPEDDIPSIDDVAAVLTREPMPVKVEWEQPEDDIPSIDDVAAVFAREPILKNALNEPAAIEFHQTVDDIPPVVAVSEVLAPEPIDDGLIIPKPRALGAATTVSVAKSRPFQPTRRPPAPQFDDNEEITHVRAVADRRIRVEWDKPVIRPVRFSPAIPTEIGFSPTLLGIVKDDDRVDADSIFSTYDDPLRSGRSSAYRYVLIGGGMVGLIAALLFGFDLTTRSVDVTKVNEPVAAKTTVIAESAIPPVETRSGAVPPGREIRTSVKSPTAGDAVTVAATPEVITTKTAPAPIERVKPASLKSIDKSPAVASTLVITSRDGRIETKTEQKSSNGATRPRIVKDPKPLR